MQSIHELNSSARSSSPRTTKSYHESITPPENYHYPSAHSRIPSQQAGHQFALDCYVKNRIAEAMRTEDDKRGDDLPDQRRTPQSQPSSSSHHGKDLDRSTPSEMVIDEDARPPSGASGNHITYRSLSLFFSSLYSTNKILTKQN